MPSPYRVPAEMAGEDDAEPRAPETWRRTTARVLGALAALNEARGASDTAETLAGRAKRARSEEPEVRQLPRCTVGLRALEDGQLEIARRNLRTWVEDATAWCAVKRDRFETHLALAAIAHMQGFHAEVDVHLRDAFALGVFALPATAFAIALATGRALVAVGRTDLAATFLDPRSERDGELEHLRAEIALANDDLSRAHLHARDALDLHHRRFGVESAQHAETRVLVARIQLRAGRRAAAENTLALAIDTFAALVPRAYLPEAEAFAHAALFLAGKGDAVRANRALERASTHAAKAVRAPCSALLPILTLGAQILHAAGESARASAWDGAVEAARAWAPPSR
jgi:hypothetical protein